MKAQQSGGLSAGVGRADITPPPGIPQGGWGAQTHQRSLGNDLPLSVRALALGESGHRVLILDMDAIGFDEPTTARILDEVAALTGLPREAIRFSCTHTHSGPNTFRLPTIREGLAMAVNYIDSLPSRAAGAAWQALQSMRPVRVGIETGRSDINVYRRCRDAEGRTFVGVDPKGPADQRVRVLRFDDAAGHVVASVLHYACHPTTMGWDNEWVTPDYPGVAKEVVERNLGGVCLFLQGATGDLGPRRGFTGDLSVYRRLGTVLGLEAARAAWNIDTQPTELVLRGIQESGARIGLYDEVPLPRAATALRIETRRVALPVREHPTPAAAEAEAEQRRGYARSIAESGSEADVREANARAVQAGMAADRARIFHGRTTLDWPLQVIRLGEIAFVGIAGEPFQEIALRIEARSPFAHTLVSGYTNGGFGYIPTREEFPAGGYEVETSPFAPEAAEVLIDAAVAALEYVHGVE